MKALESILGDIDIESKVLTLAQQGYRISTIDVPQDCRLNVKAPYKTNIFACEPYVVSLTKFDYKLPRKVPYRENIICFVPLFMTEATSDPKHIEEIIRKYSVYEVVRCSVRTRGNKLTIEADVEPPKYISGSRKDHNICTLKIVLQK